ncbi:chondroitinase family polysaccharide lyase [Rubritalea tangerina]|uniref:Chondroitinase family polysaccharide lyase n=1 Tax=Rubritalea tangerina TaxID=430798 RepID=A0ABW4ZGD1_9BACT
MTTAFTICSVLLLAFTKLSVANSPIVFDFENTLPPFENSEGVDIKRSSIEAVHGHHSLSIQWNGKGGTLKLTHPIEASNQIIKQRKHAAVFHLWIFSDSPQNHQKLRFEFGRNGSNTPDAWFDYTLNFSGWRTMMVPFNRMQGTPPAQFDWMQIRTPNGKPGKVAIDLLLPSTQFDRRHPSHDQSYQFTKDDPHSRIREGKPLDLYHQSIRQIPNPPISPQQSHTLKLLEDTLEATLLKSNTSPNLQAIRNKYAQYQITIKPDGSVNGRHIFYLHTTDIYKGLEIEESIRLELQYDLKNTGKLLLQLAKAWHFYQANQSEKQELAEMIINLNKLLLKSGWHLGHGQGTLHHFGYSSREYYTAGFLTRVLLEKHHLRDKVARSLQWFNDAHYCFAPFASTHYANLDYFNTLAKPQLQAILMTHNEGERFYALKQWRTMLCATITNDRHGNNGGFKEDGTAFHHWGHYPAYETGALNALASLFRVFSQTELRLSEEAYRSFHKALLSMRVMSNLYSWPRSISGRHPYPQDGLKAIRSAFLDFAHAGNPDNTLTIDPDVASAALRLFPELKDELPQCSPESSPNGHWTFPYAHMNAHRRADWLALARGHSRYVWASEIYGPVNHYGRYQSHGTLEILPLDGLAGSGVSEDGWDWSRPPGATITHLPIDQLPFEKVIMMPTTEETFVGSTHLNNTNGLFAMRLREKVEQGNPNSGLHALKSYSFFDDTIICLGSAISGPSPSYPVETVLFQQALPDRKSHTQLNTSQITKFPYSETTNAPCEIIDIMGNYYFVPSQDALNIKRQTQKSRYHYPSRKGYPVSSTQGNPHTQGDYQVAYLNHGITPTNAKYHYSILVNPTKERANAFRNNSNIKILQHDDKAHVVQHKQSTTYALFTPHPPKAKSPILKISAPCLIMTHETDASLQLNLCDPDLRMPGNEGGMIPGEIFVKPGNGNEQATFSITLKGIYSLSQGDAAEISHTSDTTTLRCTTRRGRTLSWTLNK